MNIQYLTKLKDNPIEYPEDTNNSFPIQGISEIEIIQLEQSYNNGNPFPKVLKELLFLAGNYCYVCDYGVNDSQQELQDWVREHMQERNKIISRPFFVFDVYNGFPFLFIYLDEGDNPLVYEADPYNPDLNWIRQLQNQTMKSIVDDGIERVKEGYNPF